MSRPLKSVVVVGRDAAAWIAAYGLRFAFARTGLEVTLVELPSLLSPVDAFAALPTLSGLHRLLNIPEDQLLKASGGLPTMGQRYANWSGGKAPFIHAYDTQPVGVNNVDLVQYWVKARGEGMGVEFDDFSLGAAMAKAGRMAPDVDLAAEFSRPAHGYQLDAGRYVDFIRARALRAGVVHCPSSQVRVTALGDRITSVTLDDGTALQADLFVDASGSDALLLGQLPGGDFESWADLYPCDRLMAASGPALSPLPAFAHIAAFRSGWIGLYPLRERTALVAAFDSKDLSDTDMLQRLTVLTGLKLEGEAVCAPMTPGMRRGWIGNCVGVGEAAVCVEPLDAVPLHLIQTSVSHLITQFPVDADDLAEARLYSASLAAHGRNIRDFQLAHYRLNQRRDEPFWDGARDGPVPEGLAHKFALFRARGETAIYDDETFQASNWTSILLGHGLVPGDYDPRVEMLSPEEQIRQMQGMLGFIAGEVKGLPTLDEHLNARPSSIGSALFG
ncbi:MAG: hypothetical protein JWR84_3179 [Caulobacter sp.]|nr:hypothetical protein [Caulobacter sp.]